MGGTAPPSVGTDSPSSPDVARPKLPTRSLELHSPHPPAPASPIPRIQPRRRGSCDRLALRSRKFHGYFLHVSSICSEAAFPNLHYKATRALLAGQTFILFDTLMAKLARANELRSPAPPEADVVDQGPLVRKHRRRAQR